MSDGLTDFYKRWNIPLNEDEKWSHFKNRTINSIANILGRDFCFKIFLRNRYLDLIGHQIEYVTIASAFPTEIDFFHNTRVHTALNNEKDIKKYIFYLERLFRLDIKVTPKEHLLSEFQNIITETGFPINIIKTKTSVLFYPAGAKLLDDKLVNDNLHWLQDYPEIYKHFEDALQLYQNGKFERSLLDNLRFSLEQLLKKVLNNDASLEKQLSNLGTFLDGKGINTEIRNMYITLIDYFTKYQNENVKHDAGYNPKEVEFIIYLTGIFMRFLMQVK